MKSRWKLWKLLSLAMAMAASTVLVSSGATYAVGTASGTVISNGGDAGTAGSPDQVGDIVGDYTEGSPITAAPTTSSVLQVFDLALTSPIDQTSGPGTTMYFSYTVTNTGNGNDTLTLAAVVNPPATWSVSVIEDTNGDGSHQAGETVVVSSTGVLAAGAPYEFFVAVTIPAGTANGSTASVTLTVKDFGGSDGNDSWGTGLDTTIDGVITTVSASIMILAASRDKATVSPDDPGVTGIPTVSLDPEAVITYAITYQNTGSAPATNFRVRNRMPANATYVAGSLKLNGASLTDVVDSPTPDAGDFGVTTTNGITVNVGTVAASGTGTIEYKVYVP